MIKAMDRTFNFKIKNGTNISFSSVFEFDYFALSMFPLEFTVELFGVKAGKALIEGIDLGRKEKNTNQLLTAVTFDFDADFDVDFDVDFGRFDFHFDFVDNIFRIEANENVEVVQPPTGNWHYVSSKEIE